MNEKLVIKKESCIQFTFSETLGSDSGFIHTLNELKKDFSAVLDCSFDGKDADVEFCFDVSENIGYEQYILKTDGKKALVCGGDVLALRWAMYDICEKNLKVSPFRSFLGFSYKKLDCIEICSIDLSPKPAYRYRGWFFNDEDYITGWRPVAGKRPVDYLFYSNIMNHETVIPRDVQEVFLRTVEHRLLLTPKAENSGIKPETVLKQILGTVVAPKVQ